MKYRRKVCYVDAEQFFPDKLPWHPDIRVQYSNGSDKEPFYFWKKSGHFITHGDYLITFMDGERTVLNPETFTAKFEECGDE